ncbi:hypothetical protein ACFIQF_07230 [Comamonas sp. J-3]
MKPIELSCLLLSGAALSGALLLGGLSASAHAASPSQAAADAVAACQGKKEGDTVELKVDQGKTAKAVCRKEKGQLIAKRTASVGPF